MHLGGLLLAFQSLLLLLVIILHCFRLFVSLVLPLRFWKSGRASCNCYSIFELDHYLCSFHIKVQCTWNSLWFVFRLIITWYNRNYCSYICRRKKSRYTKERWIQYVVEMVEIAEQFWRYKCMYKHLHSTLVIMK